MELNTITEDKLFQAACSVCFWAEMIQEADTKDINNTSPLSTEALYKEVLQKLEEVN